MHSIIEYFTELQQRVSWGWWIFGILAIEVLSYCSFHIPILEPVSFALIVGGVLIASLYRLKYGLWVAFAELCIGSKGYLFFVTIGNFKLSIRLAIFAAVWLATCVWMIRDRRVQFLHWAMMKHYVLLASVLLLAIFIGAGWYHYPLQRVFYDMNGYLYFSFIIPLTQAIRSRRQFHELIAVVFAATLAVSIKTIVLLFLFSQTELLPYTLPGLYRWIRDTGVGEITRFDNGFSRIFFQSHIYELITLCFVLPGIILIDKLEYLLRTTVGRRLLMWTALLLLITFLSYSRSFWVALCATGFVAAVWLWRGERVPLSRLLACGCGLLVLFVIDYGVAFGIVNAPLQGFHIQTGDLISARTKNIANEPAAASRWDLIQPLTQAATRHPLLGSGFGATVTYVSSDLRIRQQSSDGTYTTSAFEWGYLDLWLKLGLLGVVIYGYLLMKVFRLAWDRLRDYDVYRVETLGASAGLVVLLATHVFTPYLNHPLGIGWIVLVSVLLTLPASSFDTPKDHR